MLATSNRAGSDSHYLQEGTGGPANKIFELVLDRRLHGRLDGHNQWRIICENDRESIIILTSNIPEILQEACNVFWATEEKQSLIHGMTAYNAGQCRFYNTYSTQFTKSKHQTISGNVLLRCGSLVPWRIVDIIVHRSIVNCTECLLVHEVAQSPEVAIPTSVLGGQFESCVTYAHLAHFDSKSVTMTFPSQVLLSDLLPH
jgi:hypothetical protein